MTEREYISQVSHMLDESMLCENKNGDYTNGFPQYLAALKKSYKSGRRYPAIMISPEVFNDNTTFSASDTAFAYGFKQMQAGKLHKERWPDVEKPVPLYIVGVEPSESEGGITLTCDYEKPKMTFPEFMIRLTLCGGNVEGESYLADVPVFLQIRGFEGDEHLIREFDGLYAVDIFPGVQLTEYAYLKYCKEGDLADYEDDEI